MNFVVGGRFLHFQHYAIQSAIRFPRCLSELLTTNTLENAIAANIGSNPHSIAQEPTPSPAPPKRLVSTRPLQ